MKERDSDTHGELNQPWNEVTAGSVLCQMMWDKAPAFPLQLSFQVFVSEVNNVQ